MNVAETLLDVGAVRIPSFLDSGVCADILREVLSSRTSEVGTIIDKHAPEPTAVVDYGTRRARHVPVRSEHLEMVTAKFESLIPLLSARFRLSLTGLQKPQFIAYSPGDFFLFHRDSYGRANEPEHVKARKVSLVLFLNDEKQSKSDGDYEGGALQFYAHDFVPDPAYEGAALSVHGAAGTLVAFEPHVRHQVTSITAGNRVTVVAWLT